MSRSARVIVTTAVLIAILAPWAGAQAPMTRFAVAAVSDSTFTFPLDAARWVRAGMEGRVVNARQDDALIARFRVISIDDGIARALITGQTTRVTNAHTVLLERPPSPWWRERMLWLGAGAGAVLGYILGAAT